MRVISGSARGTVLHSIEDIKTRPTLDRVKESLFNIIQKDIEDSVVLDLFAGSGALGIESLSRGSKQATFCDKSYKVIHYHFQIYPYPHPLLTAKNVDVELDIKLKHKQPMHLMK